MAPEAGSDGVTDPLSVRERVLSATYDCVARFGLAKTTIEDIARGAGLSRATIYRHFPGGRDELIRETIGWEIGHFFTRLGDHVQHAGDLTVMFESGLVFARRALAEHALLQRILQTEPERLLGMLSTESARTLPFIAAFLLPYLERERLAGRLRPGVDLERSADYLSRMVLSLIGSPGRWDYDDPAALHILVRDEMLGGILA
jgi:AcrR family transcriptional regulator